jgi:hypothetical protein
VVSRRTATFFEGSLLWTIDQRHREAVPGFLRFMLDDETFHVVPPPPPFLSRGGFNDDESSTLSELCGRLCLTGRGISHGSLDMWVCGDIIDGVPRWERRYTIGWDWAAEAPLLRPVAVCWVMGYSCAELVGTV